MNAKDFNFDFGHIGIWNDDKAEAKQSRDFMEDMFGFDVSDTPFGWNINNNQIELISGHGAGTKGHFSILCDDIDNAVKYLESKGVVFSQTKRAYTPEGQLWKVFAENEIGGFAWHLALRGKANMGH